MTPTMMKGSSWSRPPSRCARTVTKISRMMRTRSNSSMTMIVLVVHDPELYATVIHMKTMTAAATTSSMSDTR